MIEALIRRLQLSFDPIIIDARKGGVSGDAANDAALMEGDICTRLEQESVVYDKE